MFGISAKEIKRTLAMLLAFALVLTSSPLSSFATDMGSMLNSLVKNSGNDVSGNDASGGNVSGGNVSGGDVSGSDVSSGDFTVTVVGDGKVDVTQGGETPINITVEGGRSKNIETKLGDVTAVITPYSDVDAGWRSYIASAIDENSDSVLSAGADKYGANPYTFEVAEEDLEQSLDVEFGKEYLFSVSATEGGLVTLTNGNDVNYTYADDNKTQWVDEESATLTLNVVADNGYRVKSVKVNGTEKITDGLKTEEQQSGIAVVTTTIEVTFVKIYTVTATFDLNGDATVDGNDLTSGTIYIGEWDENGEAIFAATPNANYRVASVKINDEEQVWEDKGKNDASYTVTLKKNDGIEQYKVEVTFALNEYTVAVTTNGNVTVTMNGTSVADGNYKVEYGTEVKWLVTPYDGYFVESLLVNNVDVTESASAEGKGVSYSIESVTDDVTVTVATAIYTPGTDDVEIKSGVSELSGTYYTIKFTDTNGSDVEIVRSGVEGNTPFVVVPSGTQFTFEPKAGQGANYKYISVNASDFATNAVFDGSTEIRNIKVSTSAQGNKGKVLNISTNYKIVYDETEPVVTVTAETANENGFYNEDVKVTVTIEEPTTGAGIGSVGYWITAVDANGVAVATKGSETSPEPIFTYESGAIALTSSYEFDVLAAENNSPEVKVYVKVTDLAGNTYTSEVTPVVLAINTTKPDVKVEIDGTVDEDGLEDNYNANRTATIIIIDRADTFDADAATAGVNVEGGEFSVSSWVSNGNTHTATVTFTDNAIYAWSYSYTNKADLSNNAIVESGNDLWSFTIDKEGAEVGLATERDSVVGASKLFNEDVEVTVTVDEGEDSAGIQSVIYEVSNGTEVTQSGSLYPQGNSVAGNETWTGSLTVDADLAANNSTGIVVTVMVLDMAGNTSSSTYELDIDTTVPTIEVTYDAVEPVNTDANGYKYFAFEEDADGRVATIKITERSSSFDPNSVNIVISAKNAAGEDVAVPVVSEWTTTEGTAADAAVHTATVTFKTDAIYEWHVEYTDKAGNEAIDVSTCEFGFTIDSGRPDGTVFVGGLSWSDLMNKFTFGATFNSDVTVACSPTDAISPIAKVEYYVVKGEEATTLLTEDDLKGLSEGSWTILPADGFVERASAQFVVYMRVTDYALNTGYISSAGVIADNAAPGISGVTPGIQNDFNGVGLANGNVSVSFTVNEPVVGDTSTGLRLVTYTVTSNGTITQSGEMSASGSSYSGSITVDAGLNNSNDVKVQITATDNAGNSSSSASSVFMIDTTVPTISVSYDNNTADSESYYSVARVATIAITERNFVPENVLINITNNDGVVPVISGWTSSGSGDNTVHMATIAYTADGDYTFDIAFTDAAGNAAGAVTYVEGTTNSAAFTIDRTMPAINVSYDNNDAQNGEYFAAERTATITVIEHNFIVERVVLTQTARIDGTAFNAPEIQWTHNGDTHVGRIVYDADGDYTFDITMTDMAGNENSDVDYGNSVAGQEFTVDTVISAPSITGVENGKSYKDEVIPTISLADVNYDISSIRLLRTRNGEINADVTEQFITGMVENAQGSEGKNDTFTEIADNDGIYTLIVKVADKAGNEETTTVVFTVNRFGSVYAFNDYLVSLQDSYVQKVDGSIIITEYNPDKLVEDSVKVEITKDGTPLSNVVFTVNTIVDAEAANGEGGWYQYEYVIDASNFTADGIYKVSVSSEDVAGNKPETANFKDCTVLFRVDTVNAEITSIRGLESDIVNAESQTVEFDVFDAIGLKKVTVYVNDAVAATYEEFDNIINFTGSVNITEGTNQTVRFVVEDIAGNVTDTASETFAPAFAFNNTITVSTNFWIRLMANKPLFFGGIAGVVAIVGGASAAVVLKKRKKVSKGK